MSACRVCLDRGRVRISPVGYQAKGHHMFMDCPVCRPDNALKGSLRQVTVIAYAALAACFVMVITLVAITS